MHDDKYIPLESAGTYSYGDGKSAWIDATPDELQAMLQGGNAPVFRTALAKTGEDEFSGPWYLDIDACDIEEAIDALHKLLGKLEATGLNLECVRLFASGGKGFHLEIPAACFMAEPGPMTGLPRIYKSMAMEVFVDCVDLRVYSCGRGRLWRVPNVLRDNGKFKVSITLDDVWVMTTESYAQLVSAPREFPPLAAPEFCAGLAALFDKACARESQKVSRARAWSKAETELRQRFSGACPPSIADVLAGRVQSPVGFNIVAMQVCLLAHALGWDEDRVVTECAGLIAHHAGDGRRYGTPQKRETELRRMFDYTSGNPAYSFSVAGLRSILPVGSRSPDLAGLEADEAEDAPDYVELLDAADGDAGQVVAVARRIVADPSLSRTEAEALIKRAAKSAGVAAKVLRADLWQPDEAEGSGLVIDIHRNNYAGSVDSAMAALASIPSLRVRAGQMIEVRDGDGRIVAVQLPRLAYLLSSVARWRYPEGVGGPDTAVLQGVMAAGHWPGVIELEGVAQQPTILPNGDIGLPAGYEANYSPPAFEPYTGSGSEAFAELRGLLAEFPFESRRDEAAAVGAILTAAARPALRTAPAFLITAHDLGSGKSFLAELIALFASPGVEMLRWAQRSEEQDKLLLSLLREGRPVCVFDNLLRDWQSATLAAILTSPTYADRVLGASESVSVSTRALTIATGNNVKAGADLSRRVVTVSLDARCDNPLTREFKGDPVGEVRRNRGRWVMCALRVLQDFLASGVQPKLTPLASFGEWSALVRGALHWYGLPDVIGGVVAQVAADPDREILGFVLQGWLGAFGTESLTLREALQASSRASDGDLLDLHQLFLEIAGDKGEVRAQKLGNWFASQAGRTVGGLRLVGGSRTYKGVPWGVVKL